ncbi:MAG: S41 family peptidase [Flavobacteriales bacterium]|nr:MAG: S41 family peptidase [Flavobacteriales bacterium]
MRYGALFILVLLVAPRLWCQGLGAPHYPERLRADLEVLKAAIQEAHPAPYRYITRGELDSAFDALADSLYTPLSSDGFLARLLPVLQRIGDANLDVQLDAATEQRLLAQATLLPFRVRLIEGDVYIAEELKGFRTFPQGSRLISVDGLATHRLIAGMSAWVVRDGANETLRLRVIEERFAWLFLLAFGYSGSYAVEVEAPDGRRLEEVVVGMRLEDIERSRKPDGLAMHPWQSTWDPAAGALWVSIRSLDPLVLEGSGQKPRAFIDAMLRELKDNRARVLVLDLRGCGGRELGMAELVFSAIATDPFRVVESMYVSAAQLTALAGVAEIPVEHLASVQHNYLPARHGTAMLHPDDPRLQDVAPHRHAYQGKVYVVCDGATRDAGAAVVMLAKRSGRARVVGEETGTNAHSFTGGRELMVTAPNTGVRLRIPLVRYVPSGVAAGEADRGEAPHHLVSPQPWGVAKGRDTVRLALMRMIRELQ